MSCRWSFLLLTMLQLSRCRVAQPWSSPHDDGDDGTTDAHRLPGNTRPLSYELTVRPNYDRVAETVEFEGDVKITISATTNTSTVTLNCRGLDVKAVYVFEKYTEFSWPVKGYTGCDDGADERLTVSTEVPLNAGVKYVLDIEFYYRVDNGFDGFYKSSYGHKEWLLPTYIGPTSARRIFPCYDEPAYKTPFNISLIRPRDKFSRSNMPNSTVSYSKTISSGEVWDRFIETPPMSTHQVAFVVSAFDRLSTTGDGTVINVFARPSCSDQIKIVVDEAPVLLRAMENFTELRYELPSLDLFAVPDLKSDAMGNWGLNTYREKFLLLDDTSSTKAKELGLSTVQRQMAHQWFGSLVTCTWWDYLWLHNAFAAYFQYFTTHSVHPDWRMNQMFVVEQHQPALAYDQTSDRGPITATVRSAAEIDRVFYDFQRSRKAAAFLRMLKSVTNDTIFQQSVVRYLKRNKYGAAEPDQLIEAFELTMAEYQFDFGHGVVTIADFMRRWTEQAGYPVIGVTKINGSFIVTQERFLIDTGDNVTDSSKWPVGITYTTQSRKDFDNVTVAAWCNPPEYTCILSTSADSGWFVFNVQSTGLYRVNYDGENWSSLIRHLKESPTDIHVLNRAQLIDDSFNLARANALHYSVPLKLSSYLKAEDDVLPWYSLINGYSYVLERMRRNETEYSELKACVNDLADVIYKRVEDLIVVQKNTDHTILTSWNAFSVWACGLDNKMCTQSAFEYYKKWRNGEKIHNDIRDAAFCVGIRVTNDTLTWEHMFDTYKTTKSPSEKQSAQTALACTEDGKLLSRYLNYMFVPEDGPIRAQDFKDVIMAVSSTPIGLDVLIDFLVQNVNNFREKLTDGDDIAMFMYSVCASKSALDNEINRIKNLKNSRNITENLRVAFNESYKQVENNLYWYNKYHEIVRENSGCFYNFSTTEEPQVSTTQTYTQSTTVLSTSAGPITSTDIPSTTEYSTSSGTSTYTVSPSTTEYSTSSETSTYIVSPSTTEYSTSPGTSTYTVSPSTTEYSTSSGTSTYTVSPSTTEYSTSPGTSTYTVSPSTTEYSTSSETSTHTVIPSTTEYSTSPGTSTYTVSPSTTEYSTSPGTSTYTGIPSTTEYSTSPGTSTYTVSPSTTEYSTSPGTSTYTGIPSTTEYSTSPGTSTYTGIPSTTEYSTSSETSTHTVSPSTTEYSTSSETSTHTVSPSTTEYSTSSETSTYTVSPSTTEYSTSPGTSTYTVIPSTTEYSTSPGTSTYTVSPSTTEYSTSSGTSTYTVSPSTTEYSTSSETSTYTVIPSTTELSTLTETTALTDISSTTEIITSSETSTYTVSPSTTEYSTSPGTSTYTVIPSTTEYSTSPGTSTYTVIPSTTEYSTSPGTSTYTVSPSTTEYSTSSGTSTYTVSPSTTEYSTSSETSTYTVIPSTTELSTLTETTALTDISSTTEIITSSETSTYTVIPSTTESSTSSETSTYTVIPSTTEYSTSLETSTSTDAPSTTEFSTSSETNTTTDVPSTTEYSTFTKTSTFTNISSTTEFIISPETNTTTDVPSTTEFIISPETITFTDVPSTTEYSTSTKTNTTTDVPSTTEFIISPETSTSTDVPSTTEYSTSTKTSTFTDISSTTKESSESTESPKTTTLITIYTEHYTTSVVPNSTTSTQSPSTAASSTVTSSIVSDTTTTVSPLSHPFYKSSNFLYRCIFILIISFIFSIVVSLLFCYGPNAKHIYRNLKSMSSS